MINMNILTIEYFTGNYADGVKQYKLTTVYTKNTDYDKVLAELYGKNNYFILDVEFKNDSEFYNRN
jgi:hypothetical protein